jgi:hypothetical protein
MATTIPPMIPETKPLTKGASEAKAIPRHSGSATKNTTTDAFTSFKKDFIEILII